MTTFTYKQFSVAINEKKNEFTNEDGKKVLYITQEELEKPFRRVYWASIIALDLCLSVDIQADDKDYLAQMTEHVFDILTLTLISYKNYDQE